MRKVNLRNVDPAIDDPDASIIYDQVMQLIHGTYAEYAKDYIVMRCPPSDQRTFRWYPLLATPLTR